MMKNVLLYFLLALSALFHTSSYARQCQIFPTSNIWNTNIADMPVHKDSAIWLNAIGKGVNLHPDFGPKNLKGEEVGIAVNYVDKTTPRESVLFRYASESDQVKYPFPKFVKIENGSDRHIISVDQDNCMLYELFYAKRRQTGEWTAQSGAVFDLTSNQLRPERWTSADAAGLPIYPGLVRYEEVQTGVINHAFRFTVPTTSRHYLWPARHFASRHNNVNLPPMGMWLRLKANTDLSNFSPQAKVIATTLKNYGMILADNGGPLFLSGVPNENWDKWQLRELRALTSNDFEVIDVSQLQQNNNSASTSAVQIIEASTTNKPVTPSKQGFKNKAKYYSDYFVSPYGNDAYDGTIERPWRTLQHAANLSAPGETINVEKGKYAPFKISVSGTKDKPITFIGDGAVIDAFQGNATDGIAIKNVSYINIKGFKVHHANRAGISAVSCSDVSIEWNTLEKNQYWGIFTGFCSNLTIAHNKTSGSLKQHGIYVSNTSENISVHHNESFANKGSGIHMNGDKSMGGKGIISNVDISNNRIYHNGVAGGSAINLDGVQYAKIYNNIIYDNYATGIALFKGDSSDGSKYNKVVHNTIVMPDSGRWCLLVMKYSAHNTFSNNVCINAHKYRGAISIDDTSLVGFKSDFNAYSPAFTLDDGESTISLHKWQNLTNNDKNSFAVKDFDKLFDNILKNFAPYSSSPLAGAGQYIQDFDKDFHQKPRTVPADIGALNRQN